MSGDGRWRGWESQVHTDPPPPTVCIPPRSDDFTVSMETVTAWAWGPLSFLTFLALLRRHPARYVLQLIVSLGESRGGSGAGVSGHRCSPTPPTPPLSSSAGQLYGVVLYFGTEALAGWAHCDPWPGYFWGYFVGLNGLWVLLPGALLVQAARNLVGAQRALDRPRHKGH